MTNLFFLFIPLLMLICGLLMYKFPPKKVNGFVGYRTRRSRLNADTWLFANRYCGKLWLMLGIIMLVLSGIVAILFTIVETELNDTVILIVEAVEIIILLGSIIPVEMKLKRNFDETGNRR